MLRFDRFGPCSKNKISSDMKQIILSAFVFLLIGADFNCPATGPPHAYYVSPFRDDNIARYNISQNDLTLQYAPYQANAKMKTPIKRNHYEYSFSIRAQPRKKPEDLPQTKCPSRHQPNSFTSFDPLRFSRVFGHGPGTPPNGRPEGY
jgi:hypothetical protein